MTGVRGHEPTCPIARETWCLWTGDKCDWCRDLRDAAEAHAEDACPCDCRHETEGSHR